MAERNPERRMARRELVMRLGAGLVLIPAALFVTYRGGLLFAISVSALAGLAGGEFGSMVAARGIRLSRVVLVAASALVCFSFSVGSMETAILTLTLAAVSVLVERLARQDPRGYVVSSFLTVGGIVYTGWLLGFYILLRGIQPGMLRAGLRGEASIGVTFVFLVLILTWSGDSGAYFVGSLIGRRKIAPRVSPSKTLEGTVGGIAFSLAAALVSRSTYASFLSLSQAISIGLIIGIAALVGDLVESMMKRSAGVKDSSGLIPGHGGLLDRCDSLLFTGPIFYLYMRFAFCEVWF